MQMKKSTSLYKRILRKKLFVPAAAVLVSLAAAGSSVLPAPVQAAQTYCGKTEHQHSEECIPSSQDTAPSADQTSEGHTHSDECYEEQLVCQNQDPEHVHTGECYQKVLTCQIPEGQLEEPADQDESAVQETCPLEEHTHTLECYADPNADKETESDWTKGLPQRKENETFKDYLVRVAKSQIGYTESRKNYIVDNSLVKFYSRYGQWAQNAYANAATAFIPFVLHYGQAADIPAVWNQDWNELYQSLTDRQIPVYGTDYNPEPGDVVFFEDAADPANPDKVINSYVGIITSLDPFKAAAVDSDGTVREFTLIDTDYTITGYLEVSPADPADEPEEQDPSEDQVSEDAADPNEEDRQDEEKPESEPDEENVQETEQKTSPADNVEYLEYYETDSYRVPKKIRISLEDYDFDIELNEEDIKESLKSGDLKKLVEELEASSGKDSQKKESAEKSGADPAVKEDESAETASDSEAAKDKTASTEAEAAEPAQSETAGDAEAAENENGNEEAEAVSEKKETETADTQDPAAEETAADGNKASDTAVPARVEKPVLVFPILNLADLSSQKVKDFADAVKKKLAEIAAKKDEEAAENTDDNLVLDKEFNIGRPKYESAFDEEETDEIADQNADVKEAAEAETVNSDEPTEQSEIEDETAAETVNAKAAEEDSAEEERDSDLQVFELKYQKPDSENETAEVQDIRYTASATPKKTYLQELIPAEDLPVEVDKSADVSLFADEAKNDLSMDSSEYASSDETKALEVSNVEGTLLAADGQSAVYPEFTVSYYLEYDEPVTGSNGTLDIMETSLGHLPVNGSQNPTGATDKFVLDKSGNYYTIRTKTLYVKSYADREFNYVSAPNKDYWDILRANSRFNLSGIQVNGQPDINKAYNPETVHFTNKAETAAEKPNYIQIKDGDHIILFYDETLGNNTISGTFYDYDETNNRTRSTATTSGGDNRTNSNGTERNTGTTYGINSNDHYTDSSATGMVSGKLGFGNANTGTNLQRIRWTNNGSNALNQYNNNSYKGCTFGIANSTTSDVNRLQYNTGIVAPDLFNGDINAKSSSNWSIPAGSLGSGKFQYDGNLTFTRAGDTYTLAAVSGNNISESNLQRFMNPVSASGTVHTSIFTNDFWPMDSIYNADPHTGGVTKTRWLGYGKNGQSSGNFPDSDDGMNHNNLFGMRYQVKFNLDSDYVGPLQYTFFGDDDMWVYLDNQLVVDIGGVHSSVGQRVNLDTYLRNSDGSLKSGEHTLSFYYTERGLSGSTCYMQFTLPSVGEITPDFRSGNLQIEKQTDGVPDGETFHFRLDLKNSPDDYSYTIYQKTDGEPTVVATDLVTSDGADIHLKSGQYAIIYYLPIGTEFTVTEKSDSADGKLGYKVTTSSDGGNTYQEGNSVSGTITDGVTLAYIFKNAWISLPSTGLPGITRFAVVGVAAVIVSSAAVYAEDKKRKSRK